MKLVLYFLIFVGCAVTATPPAWIDLPKDDLALLSQFEDKKFIELNRRNDSYQHLEKTDCNILSERIMRLEEIVEYLDRWLMEETISYKRAFLESIRAIAANKKWYLESLQKMDSFSLPEVDCFKGKPIGLVNRRYYDASNGMYWGEYLLEMLDPCHRQLTTFHDRWSELKKNNSAIPSFFFWLEGENLSKDIPYVTYLDSGEMLKTKVCSEGGLLRYKQAGSLVDCGLEGKEYIFIIDLNEDVYIIEDSKHISHTSLSHGTAVLGAGNILVKNGIVQSIGFVSGHYLPEISDGVQIVKILIEKKVPFSKDSMVTYFCDLEMHTISLNLFMSRFCNESD